MGNRIDLLRKLQVPRTVAELELRPARADRTRRADRPLAYQTVEGHIEKLQDLGLVHARASTRDGRSVTEYVVNHARLFLIVEELRLLTLIRAAPGVAKSQTDAISASGFDESLDVVLPQGPALVVASGPLEGTAFSLEGPGPWVIGRARGLPVALPHDLFVSARNSEVRRDGRGFVLRALPGARNGTRLNWRRLADGEEAPLAPADAIGVGRSLLIFRGG